MNALGDIAMVSLLGLGATCSNLIGAAIGLYLPIPRRLLSCILAFAAGALISALAIELAYEGAIELHRDGFTAGAAWLFIGGGFAAGAVIYYLSSLALDQKGAAIRSPTRFLEYAQKRKRQEAADTIRLLARSDLLRHLPPEAIEDLLPHIRNRLLSPGEVLFRAGDAGDALYIVARGKVAVLEDGAGEVPTPRPLAELGAGQAFGEMAFLGGGTRTATIRAVTATELLAIDRESLRELMARDRELAEAVRRLGHERAISNLAAGGPNPRAWAKVASGSLERLGRREADLILAQAARGAGLAIVIGNILDTIPGCLVIGAKFTSFQNLSLTLILGMFLGGIPEAAASGTMLRKAGYSPAAIFALWSTVLIAGVLAAIAGKMFIGGSESLTAIFLQAVAGGAVLALVAHAMIPESIHGAGSLVVLPLVAGFLVALYLALAESFA